MPPQAGSPPVDSSIPRNRRPVANPPLGAPPVQAPNATVPRINDSGGSQHRRLLPRSNQPSPQADDPPEGTNFATVPRRQDPGAVSGWKRVLER